MSNPAYEKYIESLEKAYELLKKTDVISQEENKYEGGRNTEGQPHGFGKMIYLGQGKKNGLGEMIYRDRIIYEGNWLNGAKNGSGKEIFDSGIVYEGEWENDVKHGEGILTKKDGSVFNEKWENGNLVSSLGNGSITITINPLSDILSGYKYSSGIYNGEIINNKPNGKGSFSVIGSHGRSKIRKYYIGDWLNGQPNGYGTVDIEYQDEEDGLRKRRYEGEWREGCEWNGKGQDDEGLFYYSNGNYSN